jgi:hypothetical protein
LLSRAYRKDSIPQQGRETAALRDFKPASAETRVGARPVPASAIQNRMVGFPGTGRTELAELKGGDQAPHRRRLALTRGSDRFDGLNDRPPLVTGRVVRSCFRETGISREIGISPNSEATTSMEQNMEGGCTCHRVRYRLIGTPLIVHACHCRWCQRETGTEHALNALYEADRLVHTAAEPEIVATPSASGEGQKIARCPSCRVAVWSNYPQAGSTIRFVRVGTMDNPDFCLPDIHIYTSSKQPWVTLPPGAKAVPEFYEPDAVWPAESLERRRLMRAKAQQT